MKTRSKEALMSLSSKRQSAELSADGSEQTNNNNQFQSDMSESKVDHPSLHPEQRRDEKARL